MSKSFVRLASRILIVCMIGLPLQARAGMLGTGEAVTAAQATAARDAVRNFIDRAETAGKLQAFGLTPQAARERVDALTDSEAAMLAGRLERLPAGANGAGIGILLVLIFLIYRFFVGPAIDAEGKPKEAPKDAGKKK